MNRASFLRLAAAAPWWLRHALAGGADPGTPDPRGKALAWLFSRQSEDGAWRSETYGTFQDGRALTPMVVRALPPRDDIATGRDRACQWLLGQGASLFDEYPVHVASDILGSLPWCPSLKPLADLARARLRSIQCPRTGGWSYALAALPATGDLSPMQQANLAATTMAIDGLRASGTRADDAVFQRAIRFVQACQNHTTDDATFDDGGFFQMPADPARNKAGSAGTDRHGKARYLSYASATADGLRALLLCGEDKASPRVAAAADWLLRFRWSAEGEQHSSAHLVYYTARSIGRSAAVFPGVAPAATALPSLLAAVQQPDGSWKNDAGELREDCPVVATALALEALGATEA